MVKECSEPPLLVYATYDEKYRSLQVHPSAEAADKEIARDPQFIKPVIYQRVRIPDGR